MSQLKILVKELVGLLTYTEESDGGRIFHPTTISSCRLQDGRKLHEIMPQIEALVAQEDAQTEGIPRLDTDITIQKMSREVRVELYPHESMGDIEPFAKMFLCGVVGVVLRPRGPADPHISFEIISEDDGHWFPYSGVGASSSWLDEYMVVLMAAKSWCEHEAIPDMYEGQQFGWRFKEETP